MIRGVTLFFLLLFTLLLLFTILGDTTALGRYSRVEVREWELYDPELIAATPTMDSLEQYAAETIRPGPDAQRVKQLYEIVSARFTHSWGAKYNIFSNWLLWGLGWAAAPAGMRDDIQAIRQPDQLLSRSDNGLCSQVSYILVDLANRFGYPARHVGLNGHVLMEIYHDGAWRMYDPDYEIIAYDDDGAAMGVTDLESRPDLVEELFIPRGAGRETIDFFTTAYDNTFVSYPPGSWYVWKVQLMTLAEPVTHWLKYIIPIFGILVCAILLKRIKPNRRTLTLAT